jgi:hypothetical protein
MTPERRVGGRLNVRLTRHEVAPARPRPPHARGDLVENEVGNGEAGRALDRKLLARPSGLPTTNEQRRATQERAAALLLLLSGGHLDLA